MIDQIEDALAALRPETRKQMIEELESAHADTLNEYLVIQSDSTKLKLMCEITSIETFLKTAKKVNQEYDDIKQSRVG